MENPDNFTATLIMVERSWTHPWSASFISMVLVTARPVGKISSGHINNEAPRKKWPFKYVGSVIIWILTKWHVS